MHDPVLIIITVCMIGFLLAGAFMLLRLILAGRNLSDVSKKMKTSQGAAALSDYLSQEDNNKNPFTFAPLKKAFAEYRTAAMHRCAVAAASPYTDITDYFNLELLDQLSSRSFCDWIPGTMTGLGLLGTFLGLTFGIKGFRL